jgi:hypothetical protein
MFFESRCTSSGQLSIASGAVLAPSPPISDPIAVVMAGGQCPARGARLSQRLSQMLSRSSGSVDSGGPVSPQSWPHAEASFCGFFFGLCFFLLSSIHFGRRGHPPRQPCGDRTLKSRRSLRLVDEQALRCATQIRACVLRIGRWMALAGGAMHPPTRQLAGSPGSVRPTCPGKDYLCDVRLAYPARGSVAPCQHGVEFLHFELVAAC